MKTSEIQWVPAKSPNIDDYAWGDICIDSLGNMILIGDTIDGSFDDGGCGCCAKDITNNPIVKYASILTDDRGQKEQDK